MPKLVTLQTPEERPMLDQAADFRSLVAKYRAEAQHTLTNLEGDIQRLEVQISALMGQAAEQREILARCDLALQPLLSDESQVQS